MRKAWMLIRNRVIVGMALFLAMVAAWEFWIRSRYFPEALVELSKLPAGTEDPVDPREDG